MLVLIGLEGREGQQERDEQEDSEREAVPQGERLTEVLQAAQAVQSLFLSLLF